MTGTISLNGREYKIEWGEPIDISIPLNFEGPQPNAYGVEPATSEPCQAGDLVGDTRRGGSVNFEQYTFIPHCNGTHTECVGHITHERISVRDCLQAIFIRAVLVSVLGKAPGETDESYIVTPPASDRLITRALLEAALAGRQNSEALIVRTLPNDASKLQRRYGTGLVSPYFTTEAIRFIVECGFKHLIVDVPSIDRLFDQGNLSNHRIFWNVEPGTYVIHADSRIYSTITEFIYVPDEVEDGEYLLNLQIAPFASDASPSRPILFRAQ